MRRHLTLVLAWLPCLLMAMAWPLSYRWQLDAGWAGRGIELSWGAAYLVGPDLTGGTSIATIDAAPDIPLVEMAAGVRADRRLPYRILSLQLGVLESKIARVAVVPLWVPRRWHSLRCG